MPEQTFYMYIDYMNYILRNNTEKGRETNDGFDRVDEMEFGNPNSKAQKQFEDLRGRFNLR
jgi:hypothetical protein